MKPRKKQKIPLCYISNGAIIRNNKEGRKEREKAQKERKKKGKNNFNNNKDPKQKTTTLRPKNLKRYE